MALTAIYGLLIGFVVGMGVNAYLLRGTPRADFLADKKLRMRYGGLNWAIAFVGMCIALALAQTKI